MRVGDAGSSLKISVDERGVLTILLNRPGVRNAFDGAMIAELTRVFEKQAVDEKVRVVVLGGEGPVFCAGGDLNWIKKAVDLDEAENLEDTRRLTRLYAVINECPRPVIGAVQGAAIGGGVGFVAACDLVIATRDAQFGMSEVRLGIAPACVGPFIIAKIGASWARSLFLTAERFSAGRAAAIGLVHEVVEDANALKVAVERQIQNLLQGGVRAIAETKKLVLNLSWPERRNQIGDPLDYAAKTLASLRALPEGQEGLRAFLERRKPRW